MKVSDEALRKIAEASSGGMRDALSILDQANVYATDEITIDDVDSVTGRIAHEWTALTGYIKSDKKDPTPATHFSAVFQMGNESTAHCSVRRQPVDVFLHGIKKPPQIIALIIRLNRQNLKRLKESVGVGVFG